ncbi:maleylpyruvate isomerase family mycothiol-dependent enzyme [Amycolatopsis sp. QT-25]|uniref:maleylpyruvate isomerase family mycothiol-dependent enzyme n=1 Tax=Amycolatopsis sp. QT-25 TaxID=3034022 RepID=UPI0023EC821A|nr:maleylpyruvate isomerase family mycothiol-dependent enzyme [Amycolatopsis sp. QT-25]WET82110.1 maleylpyruvate isomerase family mycothiol-dependent enzyme [Amycolatopsis sp. QT-25]
MNDGEISAWTETERLSFADLLEGLTEQDWSVTTLCPEWTVHAMAGHLAQTTRNRLKDTLAGIVEAKGDWDRMNVDQAVAYAARFTPAELVAQIREDAGSRRRSPGAKPIDPLADVLIHGQDVARPLGITRPMPEKPSIAALEHLLVSPFWGAKKRCKDLRLIATDAEWTGGTGPEEVRGPLADLLLAVSGRSVGLATLTGPGIVRLGAG